MSVLQPRPAMPWASSHAVDEALQQKALQTFDARSPMPYKHHHHQQQPHSSDSDGADSPPPQPSSSVAQGGAMSVVGDAHAYEFALRDAAARFEETRRLAAGKAALEQQLNELRMEVEMERTHFAEQQALLESAVAAREQEATESISQQLVELGARATTADWRTKQAQKASAEAESERRAALEAMHAMESGESPYTDQAQMSHRASSHRLRARTHTVSLRDSHNSPPHTASLHHGIPHRTRISVRAPTSHSLAPRARAHAAARAMLSAELATTRAELQAQQHAREAAQVRCAVCEKHKRSVREASEVQCGVFSLSTALLTVTRRATQHLAPRLIMACDACVPYVSPDSSLFDHPLTALTVHPPPPAYAPARLDSLERELRETADVLTQSLKPPTLSSMPPSYMPPGYMPLPVVGWPCLYSPCLLALVLAWCVPLILAWNLGLPVRPLPA